MTPPEVSGTTMSGSPGLGDWPCRFSTRIEPGAGPVPIPNPVAYVPPPAPRYTTIVSAPSTNTSGIPSPFTSATQLMPSDNLGGPGRVVKDVNDPLPLPK